MDVHPKMDFRNVFAARCRIIVCAPCTDDDIDTVAKTASVGRRFVAVPLVRHPYAFTPHQNDGSEVVLHLLLLVAESNCYRDAARLPFLSMACMFACWRSFLLLRLMVGTFAWR